MKITNGLDIIVGIVFCVLAQVIGAQCPQSCDGVTENTVLGIGAYPSGIGGQNTAIGYGVLANNSGGTLNTAIGYHALESNTSGNYNTACGEETLQSNTTGGFNAAFGDQALYSNILFHARWALQSRILIISPFGPGLSR